MADVDPFTADFATRFPDAFARIVGRADAQEIATVVDKLPRNLKASIVARLSVSQINQLLDSGVFSPGQWLIDASFDDAVSLLSRIPRERRLAMVSSLEDRDRKLQLLRHQQYPTHSVGALVSDVVLRIRSDTQAADVIEELRNLDVDSPAAVVVVDADGRYFGLLNVWRLLASQSPVGKIRDYTLKVAPIYPETPIASAVQQDEWHQHNWLAVVDYKQRVLGGVARSKLFRAAGASALKQRGAVAVFFDLAGNLIYVLGELLDRILSRRSAV